MRSREATLESLQRKMEQAYQVDCERADAGLLPEGYHEAEAEARRVRAMNPNAQRVCTLGVVGARVGLGVGLGL